jgi:hypothetical protein
MTGDPPCLHCELTTVALLEGNIRVPSYISVCLTWTMNPDELRGQSQKWEELLRVWKGGKLATGSVLLLICVVVLQGRLAQKIAGLVATPRLKSTI